MNLDLLMMYDVNKLPRTRVTNSSEVVKKGNVDVGGHQDGACLAPASAAGGVPRGGSRCWC